MYKIYIITSITIIVLLALVALFALGLTIANCLWDIITAFKLRWSRKKVSQLQSSDDSVKIVNYTTDGKVNYTEIEGLDNIFKGFRSDTSEQNNQDNKR